METAHSIEGYIEELVRLFDLGANSATTYEGETEAGVPVSVAVLQAEPPSVMIRIAINRSRFPLDLSHIPNRAQPAIASGQAKAEAAEYFFTLSAYDLSETDPAELAAIAREAVELLDENGLFEPKPCSKCGKAFDSAPEYFAYERICGECTRRKQERREELEAELNKPKPLLKELIPVAILLAAGAWMGLWIGYEFIFFKAGTDSIVLPGILVLLILIGIGIAFGYPMGRLVRRSGLLEKFSAERSLLIIIAVSVILGEILFSWVVFSQNGIRFSFRSLWEFWTSYGAFYAGYKILVATAIYFASQSGSKPKKLPA